MLILIKKSYQRIRLWLCQLTCQEARKCACCPRHFSTFVMPYIFSNRSHADYRHHYYIQFFYIVRHHIFSLPGFLANFQILILNVASISVSDTHPNWDSLWRKFEARKHLPTSNLSSRAKFSLISCWRFQRISIEFLDIHRIKRYEKFFPFNEGKKNKKFDTIKI